jgi:cytochrome c1
MGTQPQRTELSRADEPVSEEQISDLAKYLMWLFVLVFLGFGLILFGELLLGLWR